MSIWNLHISVSSHLCLVFKFKFLIGTNMRISPLTVCFTLVLGAKNPECPNEIASEECEEDCVRANTECILECDDGNCIRPG